MENEEKDVEMQENNKRADEMIELKKQIESQKFK